MSLFKSIGKFLGKGLGFLAGPAAGLVDVGMGLLARNDAKSANNQAREDDLNRFVRLRQGAEMAGFNPLTALQYGGAGGGIQYNAPPLASMQMIQSGLSRVGDEISGKAQQQRQRDQLELELAKIKLDDAKAQGIARQTAYNSNIKSRQTGTAFKAATVPKMGKAANAADFDQSPFAPGRELDIAKNVNSPGHFTIQNDLTGGHGIHIPGDSEPWGIDELATAVIVGLPQISYSVGQHIGNQVDATKARRSGGFTSGGKIYAPEPYVPRSGRTRPIARPSILGSRSTFMPRIYD